VRGLKDLVKRGEIAAEEDRIPRPSFHWKTRVALPGLIMGGFLTLLGATTYHEVFPAVEVNAGQVVLKRIQGAETGSVTVQAAGWIEAEPYKSYGTALSDGIVREVLVLEGDSVKTGQVVVRLVDEDARLAVKSAEARVKEIEASLDGVRADLAAARTEWENPVERTRAIEVSEAQLAETRANVAQIAAEIILEESNLEHIKNEYDKGVGLYGSSSISESELIRRRSQFHAQQAKIEAYRMRHSATKELVARREADLKAAKDLMRLRTEERRKLDQAQATVLKTDASLNQARTALAEAQLRLERMEIRSPMDGIVMSRLTEPGSKVVVMSDNPGSARVLSLYDPLRLQVRVDVPLAEAGKIGAGQLAEVAVDVLADRTFKGAVTRVLHEANIQKNTLEVKVGLSDPAPQLRPEMLARVKFLARIDVEQEKDRPRVFAPDAAVRTEGGNPVAWVVTDFDGSYGIAAVRPIRPGTVHKDGWVDIAQGLQPGDLVITRSSGELKNGKRVRVAGE